MKGDPTAYPSPPSGEQLLALVEKLPVAALFIDGDEQLYCNRAAESLTGFSNSDVATLTAWLEKILEPVHGSLRELYEQYKAAGFPAPRDFLITCRDGSHRMIEFTAKGTEQVYCVMHDVTDRLRAEQKLRDNETLLREAQRVGNLGIYDYDIVADAWSSSPEMDAIFGIDADFPRTFSSWLTIIHPECRDQMGEYFTAILADLRWFDMEYRIIRPGDGLERWVYGTGEFTCDAAGRPVRMFGTIQDITERKKSEILLRESEERYRRFSSLTSDYVYSCSRSGDNQFKNQWMGGAVTEVTGYPMEEIMSWGCWLPIVHPDDVQWVSRRLLALVPGDSDTFEFRLIRKDGVIRWIRESCSCEQGGTPGELLLYGTSADVTGRKAAEAETAALNQHLEELVAERTVSLEKSNAELAGFSYAVSHELRAPITRIQGFSAILGEVCRGSDETAFMASRIEHASRELQTVVDSILMLSRLSLMALSLQPVDLSGMAARKLEKLIAENPGRTVEAVVMPGVEAVADPDLMNVCLDNLLGNAFKFTGQVPSARIEFGLLDTAGKKIYFVRDNGAGFDMAYAEKLYAPFQRLHQSQEFPGSGIGLATVKRIISRHGGEVWAESGVGQGATFYFTLGGGG